MNIWGSSVFLYVNFFLLFSICFNWHVIKVSEIIMERNLTCTLYKFTWFLFCIYEALVFSMLIFFLILFSKLILLLVSWEYLLKCFLFYTYFAYFFSPTRIDVPILLNFFSLTRIDVPIIGIHSMKITLGYSSYGVSSMY